MKIAINGILLGEFNTGVENYIRYLMDEFNQIDRLNPPCDLTVFLKAHIADQPEYQWQNLQTMQIAKIKQNRLARITWEHFHLPIILKDHEFDLLHSPAYIIPLFSKIPTIVTIHDIIALRWPELCKKANVLYFKIFLPYSLNHADKIIVPSVFVKKEVLRSANISPKKIAVIPEGVHNRFKPEFAASQKARIRARLGLPERFLLYVGNIEPKKNIDLVLGVFEQVYEKHKDVRLVIAGKIGWGVKKTLTRIKQLQIDNRVITTGYVPDDELAIIYNLAELFLFPSLIEGFGIPPLEAMASGTPVIASNRGAIPEVVGAAAVTIDPDDPGQYVKSVSEILAHPDRREELRQKGLERVKLFSWKKCFEMTREEYLKFNKKNY